MLSCYSISRTLGRSSQGPVFLYTSYNLWVESSCSSRFNGLARTVFSHAYEGICLFSILATPIGEPRPILSYKRDAIEPIFRFYA